MKRQFVKNAENVAENTNNNFFVAEIKESYQCKPFKTKNDIWLFPFNFMEY